MMGHLSATTSIMWFELSILSWSENNVNFHGKLPRSSARHGRVILPSPLLYPYSYSHSHLICYDLANGLVSYLVCISIPHATHKSLPLSAC